VIRILLLALPGLLASCGDDGPMASHLPDDAGPGDGGLDAGDPLPPEICKDPPALGAQPWFSEVTDEIGVSFGLLDQTIPDLRAMYGDARTFGDALGTTWMMTSAADIDADGWIDVFVHIGPGPAVLRDPMASGEDYYYRRVLRAVPGAKGIFPIYEDVTVDSGYLAVRAGEGGRPASGAIFGDVDNDGNVDLFSLGDEDLTLRSEDRAEVMLGDGAGRFELAPQSGPSEDDWSLVSASLLDYDLDGILDLFMGYWWGTPPYGRQNRLFHGSGDGTFEEVTEDVGLATTESWAAFLDGTSTKPTFGTTACDIDRDGDPDLITSTYGRQFNALWRNDGGTFVNIAQETGFAADDELDYTDDQFYLCWCSSDADCVGDAPQVTCPDPDQWQPGYSDVPNQLGGNTFATACEDLDDDGDLDLISAEIRHWWAGRTSDASRPLLQEPGGDAGFRFARPDLAEIGMEQPHYSVDWNEGNQHVGVFDFDNDGRKDVYMGSSDYPDTDGLLYRRTDAGVYEDVTDAADVRIPRAHDVMVTDLDHDGDRDLVVGTALMRDPGPYDRPSPRFFRNDVGQDSNWTAIRLHGSGSGGANASGIGAVIEIEAANRTQVVTMDGGHGLGGMHDGLVAWAGLGDACRIDVLRVFWPDAAHSVSEHFDVLANYAIDITQGQERVRYEVGE